MTRFFDFYVDAVATLGDLYRNSFLVVKRGKKKSSYELLKVSAGGKMVRTHLRADAAPEGIKALDAKAVKDGVKYDSRKGYFIDPAVEAALVRVRPAGFSRDEGKPLTQNLGDLMKKAGF